MSTKYMIYDKYAYALGEGVRELSRGNRIHIDAARLALRLALDELAESISPILPTLSTENDRQRHEFERRQINSQLRIGELEQEINSLYGWLAEHMPDATLVPASTAGAVLAVLDKYRLSIEALEKEAAELRSQIAQLDADNAALIRRNKDLADELKRARLDAALTAFERDPDSILFRPVEEAAAAANPPYVLPTVASATILNTDHPNGTTITVTPAPAAKASMWDDPASLTTLPADILDYWDGIAAGRWTWRRLPKPVRLAMVRHVLSFGPEDGAMTMAEFDAVRPEWMTAAASLPTTFGCSWSELNDLRTEIEVRS